MKVSFLDRLWCLPLHVERGAAVDVPVIVVVAVGAVAREWRACEILWPVLKGFWILILVEALHNFSAGFD